MSEMAALIAKAEEILAADPASRELVVQVETYAELFEQWQFAVGDNLAASLASPEGTSLVRVHAAVLARAKTVQGEVAIALKGLRKRGKGILAYTDSLPKSIATIKPRKG
jgi:hypothetical protein